MAVEYADKHKNKNNKLGNELNTFGFKFQWAYQGF